MTKKERVLAVLNGQKPDEIPSGFWLHFPEGFENGEPAVSMHLKFFEESRTSICKIMNENTIPKNPLINTAADWSDIKPIPKDDPIIVNQIALVKEICGKMKGEAVMVATIHGIVASTFHCLCGVNHYNEKRMMLPEMLRENPEGLKKAFGVVADYLSYLAAECVKAGCDGIYYAALGGEKFMFTDEEYEEFVKPFDLQVLNAVKDAPCNILHMCKDGLNLNRYAGYPAAVYNWGIYSDNPSLVEGRKLFGEDKVYLGGLDDRSGVLVDGSDEDIIKAVHSVMDEFGTDRFILGADCTLPTDVELHRVHVAIDAANSYLK
ncbi:uroporphyrinogen decarboxylase family protein [Anaerolentibacter hominis]|uniref:uroporphyrinogen decarboxylase family protein n=1 Tax=Anaerolentibacter hominis TaxID=3079009 RepID=UPI0031B8A0AE